MSQRKSKSEKPDEDVTANEALPEASVEPLHEVAPTPPPSDGLTEVHLLDVNREFVESVRIDRADRRFRIYRSGQQYHHVDTTGDDIWRYAPES